MRAVNLGVLSAVLLLCFSRLGMPDGSSSDEHLVPDRQGGVHGDASLLSQQFVNGKRGTHGGDTGGSGLLDVGDVASVERYVGQVGKSLYFLAFPTATYESARLLDIKANADRTTSIVILVSGVDAFDHAQLWTEAALTVRAGEVRDLRFRASNSIRERPGATMKSLGGALAELNKAALQRPDSASVTVSWAITNACSADLRFRMFEKSTGRIIWPSTPGSEVILNSGQSVAISTDVSDGDQVCLGAAPIAGSSGFHWGVGPQNDEDCKTCCRKAGAAKELMRLVCP